MMSQYDTKKIKIVSNFLFDFKINFRKNILFFLKKEEEKKNRIQKRIIHQTLII